MARLIVKVKTTAPRPQESDDTNTVVLMVGSTPQGDKGLKGDKGDKGEQGEQGVQGLKGDKGDKGEQGEQGVQGLKGDKGETGASGTGAWGSITGNIVDQLDLTQLYYTKTEADGINQFLVDGVISASLNGAYYDTTTTAYPNVNIAADGALSRSTATFGTAASRDVGTGAEQIPQNKNLGTAAYKNVGTAAGNVMEVGAFGLGRVRYLTPATTLKDQHIAGFGSAIISSGVVPSDAPDAQIGKVVYIGDPAWGSQVWFSYNNSKVYFRNREVGAEYESWKEFYHSGTPNLAANSIQAGIGAPKIAYKKLTGVTMINTGVPHGLDASKILSIAGSYLNGGVYWSLTPKWDATEVDIKSTSSGFSYKLLITYEV